MYKREKNMLFRQGFLAAILLLSREAFARDIPYSNQEVEIRVSPGEPPQVEFPGTISGGFKK